VIYVVFAMIFYCAYPCSFTASTFNDFASLLTAVRDFADISMSHAVMLMTSQWRHDARSFLP